MAYYWVGLMAFQLVSQLAESMVGNLDVGLDIAVADRKVA